MSKVSSQIIIVPQHLHGQRVDAALAQLMPDYSRSQLSQWLKQHFILVNNQPRKPKDKIAAGDEIACGEECFTLGKSQDTHLPEAIPLTIVYEDDALLVVNKPAGLIVHPGAGNYTHTLVNALLHHDTQLQELPRAGIVHRLDKDTTGLLVIGKTLTSYNHLVKHMQQREIQRRYLTLVHGHLIGGGEIDTFYGRHSRNRLKMAVCAQGKQAITRYSIHKHYQYFTLLDVELLTGRTHQIRVHMAHIHHPVVGDPLYGKNTVPAGIDENLRQIIRAFPRQALHAASLSLVHPTHKELLTFTAPLPDDFHYLLQQLDHYLV